MLGTKVNEDECMTARDKIERREINGEGKLMD